MFIRCKRLFVKIIAWQKTKDKKSEGNITCVFISSPEPKAEMSIVIAHRASSVRNLSHYQFLLQNRLLDFDETW